MKICVLSMGLRNCHISLRRLLQERGEHIGLIVRSTGGVGIKRLKTSEALRRAYRRAGPRYLAYQLMSFFSYPLLSAADALGGALGGARRVVRYDREAARRGIRTIDAFDVNAPEIVQQIRAYGPDLIIAAYFDQMIGDDVIALPRYGCINVHPSLLPDFRGTNPNFWAKLKGRAEVGTTLHYVSNKLDRGQIVLQRARPVAADESVMEMDTRAAVMSGDLLIELVDRLVAGERLEGKSQGTKRSRCRTIPKRKDIARFHAKGHRLVRLRDLLDTGAPTSRERPVPSESLG